MSWDCQSINLHALTDEYTAMNERNQGVRKSG